MKKITLFCFAGALATICGYANTTENNSMAQEYIDLVKNWKNPKKLAAMCWCPVNLNKSRGVL